MAGVVATAEIDIAASSAQVWTALTDPDQIKRYMFGTTVDTDWRPGNAITWKGVCEGKSYEDKGEIIDVEPARRLTVTHFSPLSGQEDLPENYHTLTYELEQQGNSRHVSLSQDNNASEEEAKHSQRNWETMPISLKKVVEGG